MAYTGIVTGSRGVIQQPQLGEVDLTLLAWDAVGDPHRLPPAATAIAGAFGAEPVQRAMRHHHVTFLIKPGEGLQATGHGMTCCPCRSMIWGVLSPWPEGANDR